MTVSPAELAATVRAYLDTYPDQADYLKPLTELLAAGIDITARDQWAGHATASVIATDEQGRVLTIHHEKYNLRIQPGGHLEPGDQSMSDAALRELAEETGLCDGHPDEPEPFHITVHDIPAYPAKGEPAHLHFDFRFAVTATTETLGGPEIEQNGAAWITAAQIENPSLADSVARLAHLRAQAPTAPDRLKKKLADSPRAGIQPANAQQTAPRRAG